MTEEEMRQWVLVVTIVFTTAQAVASYLFFRWYRKAKRRWVRLSFLGASIGSLLLVGMIVVRFTVIDEPWLRILTLFYFVVGHCVLVGMFGFATRLMEKRILKLSNLGIAPMEPSPRRIKSDTADFIEALIGELQDAGIKPNHRM